MSPGPFNNKIDACEAFAAFQNCEESPTRFLDSLHPFVSLSTKCSNAKGKASVLLQLADWAFWEEPPPLPITHVTIPTSKRIENGEIVPICCSFYINEPTRIQTETYITLEDGWVRNIAVYSVWLDPQFPFPERVHEVVARLRLKGVPLIPSAGYRSLMHNNLLQSA